MKKIAISLLSAAALVLASCASTAAAPEAPNNMAVAYPPKVLEHQNSAFGGDVPSWVTMEQSDVQAQDKYKDVYVFKFETVGAGSVDAAVLAGTNFDVLQPIAQQVSVRVQAKFAGAQVGDKAKVETYMENVVKSLTDAKFSGLKKESQFWVKLQNFTSEGKPDNQEFRVRFLYSIPKKTLDDQIAKQIDAIDAADQPKTEDERTARARVRESLSEGL
ncbi:MAG: hypothetical protein A2Z96_04405 [Spirochaetes bacterium GWB1_48_6]|nr:MAG: hypothetical protein A2Z96_04405 [Spirochaetes bacterium GWB1_48_6]